MRFIKNAGIGQSLQALIAEMNDVMALLLQPVNDPMIDTRVAYMSTLVESLYR